MVKKYEITSDCKTVEGVKVCRIKALKDIDITLNEVKKGDLGGYVENESNLSQKGKSWVKDDAVVMGKAEVSYDALIRDNAVVRDHAVVQGNALVDGATLVKDYAFISDYAEVKGNAVVSGESWVRDNAIVRDNVVVEGNAVVECNTKLLDSVKVSSGSVCAPSTIFFDSQDKLDNYLKDVKKYEDIKE
jgi:carbonic anhydrase/acetyltransferase-like protein (isoleucine patch superfamily)